MAERPVCPRCGQHDRIKKMGGKSPTAGSRRYRDDRLTVVPDSDTKSRISLNLQDGSRVTPAAGASAVPAGGGSSLPSPGGSGKTPGRHHDRSARSSLDWDRPASGNA
jgi:hypothetical protein